MARRGITSVASSALSPNRNPQADFHRSIRRKFLALFILFGELLCATLYEITSPSKKSNAITKASAASFWSKLPLPPMTETTTAS